MYDMDAALVLAAKLNHQPDCFHLGGVRPRGKIGGVSLPIIEMLADGIDGTRQLGVNHERYTRVGNRRHRSLKLSAVHHGESIDARMNQEAFEPEHAGSGQRRDMLLVIRHYAAPESVVNHAVPSRGRFLRS